jgi:hypothetical protein
MQFQRQQECTEKDEQKQAQSYLAVVSLYRNEGDSYMYDVGLFSNALYQPCVRATRHGESKISGTRP